MTINVFAYDYCINGIYYNVLSHENMTCEVTYATRNSPCNDYRGEISIPETINLGSDIFTVIRIGDEAFSSCYVTNIKLPQSIQSIGKNAFYGTSIDSIDLPCNLRTIGDYAFMLCRRLARINIPNEVNYIGEGAFYLCDKLATINWPYKTKQILPKTFVGCETLQGIIIPEGMEEIGDETFSGCKSIISINLPETVCVIGNRAFENCSSIKEIQVPGTIKTIGDSAFAGCINMSKITLEEGVAAIGKYAFMGDFLIESLSIPNSVTSIGEGALTLGNLGQTKEIKLYRLLVGNGLEEFGPDITSYVNVGWSFPREVIFGKNIKTISDSGLLHRGSGHGLMPGAIQYLLTNNTVAFCGCPYNRTHDCTVYVADSTKYSEYDISKYNIKNICHSDKYTGEYSGIIPKINLRSELSGFKLKIDSNCFNVGSYSNIQVTFSNDTITSTITIPCDYVITKAPLTITPYDVTISYGENIPAFSCIYQGFKNSETPQEALSKLPSVTTNAHDGSDVGEYKLYASGAESKNYSLAYYTGTLTIKPAQQTIIWNQSFDNIVSDSKVELQATSSCGLKVQYSSSDPTIAYVSEEGGKTYLYTRKDGTIILTASQPGNKNYEAATNVEKTIIITPRMATGISLSRTNIDMKVGDEYTLVVTVTPETTIDKTVDWSSSDNTIATVSNGVIHALKLGEATIQAKTKDGSNLTASCRVNVIPTMVESVSLSKSEVQLILGNSERIFATILPANVTNKAINWEVENPNIASVNDGLITALGIGNTTVKAIATDGSEIFAICSVIVNPISISSIELSPSSAAINVGESLTLTAIISPSNASNQQLLWQSLDNDVASVTNGVVIGKRPGNVIITAKSTDGSNKSAIASIKVNDILASNIYLDKSSISMLVGDEETLVATITPKGVTSNEVIWTTTNSAVATVRDGVVVAKGYGNATITATTTDGTDLSAMCQISVDKRSQSISWSQSFYNVIYGGQLIELSAKSSSGLKIKYKSNDENIVSIFDLGDIVYLNPENCGKTSIIAYQEGNYEYYPSEEYQKEVEVVNTSTNSTKVLVAYYSQSSLIDAIVAELTNLIAYSGSSVYIQKIEPVNDRINEANTNSEVRDSIMMILDQYPNETKSYPEINTINVNIGDYDNVIMVYPLWTASMAAPMQTFNFYYKDILEKKSNAYIEYDLFDEADSSSNAKVLRFNSSNIEDMGNVIEDWLNNSEATGIVHLYGDKKIHTIGIYDLQGRKLQSMPNEGVFIINGNKTVINDGKLNRSTNGRDN